MDTISSNKTPTQMIQILPPGERGQAGKFVALGEKLNCKSTVRYARSHKSWKCVFSRKNPARVLFTVECSPDKWHVKACLWNIDAYSQAMSTCSKNIVNGIAGAYDCISCNDRCTVKAGFTLGGKEYVKCIGNSFYFSCLEKNEWGELYTLIEKEFEASNKKA